MQFLSAVLLAVVVLLAGGLPVQAVATAPTTASQPAEQTPAPTSANPLEKLRPLLKPSAPSGLLQEVAAPLAVQQIQEALADRQPRVTVEAPNDGANLPSGNWTLKLRVQDWPLHDGGALGIGPHVVIQVDDDAPIRLSEHRSGPKGDSVQITLPPLSPGSHRITAYAATPWGEAARTPGAVSQIRVHRVAANPLTLPEAGSPQVLGVSPLGTVGAEPVLLDWLLLDAPLQHLRDNDGSWRLRISINDERFVVDQNVPLWLKGWKTGSNSLQLELVDGRGKPLNPPFNSLVSEVVLKPAAIQPRWQQGRLSPAELASLLGQTPPPAVTSPPVRATPPSQRGSSSPSSPTTQSPQKDAPKPGSPQEDSSQDKSPQQNSPAVRSTDVRSTALGQPKAALPPANLPIQDGPIQKGSVQDLTVEDAPVADGDVPSKDIAIEDIPVQEEPFQDEPVEAVPSEDVSGKDVFGEDVSGKDLADEDTSDQDIAGDAASGEDVSRDNVSTDDASTDDAALDERSSDDLPAPIAQPEGAPAKEVPAPSKQAESGPSQGASADQTPEVTSPDPDGTADDSPPIDQGGDRQGGLVNAASPTGPSGPKPIANPDRLSPSSNVAGSARDQVREDGSLIKPKREGLLGGLLDRLGA